MEKNFTFNEVGHRYELDGKALTGVTTILGVIAKPALIPWAVKMTADWIIDNCEANEDGSYLVSDAQLVEAKAAHRKKKESAGDIGTACHKWIEEWIKDNTIALPEDPKLKIMVLHFVKWAKDNNVKFLESEKRLYSEKHWYAGTCDLVMEIDGKVWIGDIKTSSDIYTEAFWQMGGYHIMFEEMNQYPGIAGYIVLNIKKDGKFQEKRSISIEDNRKAFLACLDIYKIQEKIKSNTLS